MKVLIIDEHLTCLGVAIAKSLHIGEVEMYHIEASEVKELQERGVKLTRPETFESIPHLITRIEKQEIFIPKAKHNRKGHERPYKYHR